MFSETEADMSEASKAAISLADRADLVSDAVEQLLGIPDPDDMPPGYPPMAEMGESDNDIDDVDEDRCVEVYDNVVVLCTSGAYWQAAYTLDMATGAVTFAPRAEWIQVEQRWLPVKALAFKAGARHSSSDAKMIQTMHDHSVSLGASCAPAGKAIVHRHAVGNALKAISRTDSELRVANYMVLFGGRDLEGIATPRRNQDGSKGEYFSKATQFDSSYTDVGTLYVDWEHGMYGGAGEPGADEVLGHVDWKSARIDDKGLFVERVLNRRNKYVQYLEQLIGDGLIGNSSQAVAEQVQKAANGEILKWPLLRDTLTVAPMEPRMLTANSLAALKALSAGYPALKTIVAQAEMFSTPEATPKATRKIAAVAERDALLLELDLLALEMTP